MNRVHQFMLVIMSIQVDFRPEGGISEMEKKVEYKIGNFFIHFELRYSICSYRQPWKTIKL